MGGALNGSGLSGSSGTTPCLAGITTQHIQFSQQGLHRASEDERTVRTACLKPVCRMGLHTAEGFQRTGTRRISSWPGEINLHKQAGYIDADFLHRNTFPLQSDGGPYISATSPRTCRKPDFSGAKRKSDGYRRFAQLCRAPEWARRRRHSQ